MRSLFAMSSNLAYSSDGSWTGRCAIRICRSMKPEISAEARKASSTRYLGDDRVHEHCAPQSASQASRPGLVLSGDAQREALLRGSHGRCLDDNHYPTMVTTGALRARAAGISVPFLTE